MNIPTIDASNSNTLKEFYHKKRYPEFYEYINTHYPISLSFKEKLFWFFNDIHEYPVCATCGGPVKFVSFGVGYRRFCCGPCVSKNEQVKEDVKKRNIEKYGVDNPSKSIEILNKITQTNMDRYGVPYHSQLESAKESTKKTCMERYGGNAPMSSTDIRDKSSATKLERYGDKNYNNRDKCKSTMRNRYGVENPTQLESVKQSIKQTCMERYGVEHPSQLESVKQSIKQTCMERYGVDSFSKTDKFKDKLRNSHEQIMKSRIPDILKIEYNHNNILYTIKCPHDECNKCPSRSFDIPPMVYYNRINQGAEVCTNILPVQKDRKSGTTPELFIRYLLDEYEILYDSNNRSILGGKELDIYIPDKKVAIECNGIYWHSLKPKTYHYSKWKACKDKGIQLLSIWEDQIINKPDVVRNIVLSKLGIYKERIHARKCVIRNVTSKKASEFLITNHLQGSVNGSIRIGLYNGDELISLMVFGRKRKALGSNNEEDIYELYRYCNKSGVQVIGGASKLFQSFVNKYPGCKIESFSSNDISDGNLYRAFGFELVEEQKSSYWYIDNGMNRYHRYSFRKDILVKNGADPTLTEFQITDGMGLYRIYDSGQQKWIFNPTSKPEEST